MNLPKPYYEDEAVTIYNTDCRRLLDIGFDAVVTDPPYGVNFRGKSTKWTKASGGYFQSQDDDSVVRDVSVPMVKYLIAQSAPVVITPGIKNMFKYPEPRAVGTIFYPSGAGMGPWGFICSQPIFYYGPDPYLAASLGSRPDSFTSTEASEINGHPCPKPIHTMRWLVNKASLPGQTILDPFAGSGTTLRAAKDLGRKAIGIEIEERYCEIAAKRLAQGVLPLEVS